MVRKRAIIITLLLVAALCLASCSSEPEVVEDPVVVVCIGDSITFGAGVNSSEKTYPGKLQKLLGSSYTVKNRGGNGRTLQRDGKDSEDDPEGMQMTIWDSMYYNNAIADNPEIMIVMFGTNDAKWFNWNAEQYEATYVELINTFKALETSPDIYIMIPPAAFEPQEEGEEGVPSIDRDVVANELGPIVRRVAESTGSGLIDIYSITKDHPEYFPDGIHPNAEGNTVIAQTVYDAVNWQR